MVRRETAEHKVGTRLKRIGRIYTGHVMRVLLPTEGLSCTQRYSPRHVRLSSGVQRSGSKSASDENDRSTNPIVLEHKQVLIRGASTVPVPNSVWMVSVRQSH
jgi:hypothetical protein